MSSSHCICSKDLTKCIYDNNNEVVFPNIISIYPGQTLHIPMVAKDVVGNNLYTTVSLTLTNTKDTSRNLQLSPLSSQYISPHDENQVVLESQQCTLVNFTLFKRFYSTEIIITRMWCFLERAG